VSASRVYKDGSGPCLGNYLISLEGWNDINGVKHLAILGAADVQPYIPNDKTFNRPIILGLERVFAAFPRK